MSGGAREERLKRLAKAVVDAADAAGVAVFVAQLDLPDHPAVYVSQSAAALLGYPPEELTGVGALSFAAADQTERLRELIERRLRGEEIPTTIETAIERRDGTRLPIEASTSFVEHDGRLLSVTFMVDISAQKLAQAALERSEARFRRLIESAPEAIWILDANGLAYANPAAIALFGYERLDEVLGADPRVFAHAEDVPMLERRARAMLRQRERLAPHEYRVKRRDGRLLTVEVSSIAIDYEGRPAILSFARDITERKAIEAQLLQADRLATLGMLAGGMAHAINNPLSYVMLDLEHLTELLPKLAVDPTLADEVLVRLREAHQGADRIAQVVRRMRTFSRVDDQSRGPVDVGSVLAAAVDMVGNEIRHRGRLVMDVRDAPPVYANPARLEQVFLSLLVHAAQSLPESGDLSGEVRLTVRSDGLRSVVVAVGYFTPEPVDAEQLTDPFIHDRDQRGMNLAVCRSIVGSLGGEIRVDDDSGRGTRFTVFLPAAGPSLSEPPPPSSVEPSVPAPGVRARVLVIDDDPGVGDALRLMLEDEHVVACVGSANEALELLARGEPFDVMFCDLMMPDVGGEELFGVLAREYPGLERKLVFMTGGAFTKEAVAFLARVPNPRLEKPFDLKALRRLVERAASRRWLP